MDITVIIILGIIGLAILLAFFVMIKSSRKGLNTSQQNYINKHWVRIINAIEQNPNQSILEADKLLGYALKARGVEGSVGEQLKKAPALFSDVNLVWDAHKLRNKLAHEIGMEITPQQAKSYLNYFKKALKDLGANL